MNFTTTTTHQSKYDASTGLSAGYMSVQGGCLVGNDLYSFMVYVDNSYCNIIKTDMTTGASTTVATGLDLGHANDAAFNGTDIIVTDCGANDGTVKTLYVIELENYTVKQTITLDETVVSIAYDEINERYVTIGYQNDYINIYDKDFNLIKRFVGVITDGYAAQGILTDGTYLYMLEYYSEKNNLCIFDLATGERVKVIDIGIAREAENIVYKNGDFFVTCNNDNWTGREVYQISVNEAS